jgi:uncharacterized protein
MIHPDTELRFINHNKGRGVFATKPIPKGTITYVSDSLEIEILPDDSRLDDPRYKKIIETFSFIDRNGTRIISWDHAKYVNHCCHCNTMSTGYGFEIAIRDIAADEEITDEYGMFNFTYEMEIECDKVPCRNMISGNDLLKYHEEWDHKVRDALQRFKAVTQPLATYLDDSVSKDLDEYLRTGNCYKSVRELVCSEILPLKPA